MRNLEIFKLALFIKVKARYICKSLESVEKVEKSKYVSDNVKEMATYKGRGFGKI